MSSITVKEQLASCRDHVSHKRLANNTVQWIDNQGNRYIRLHRTDILTFTLNNSIIISSGGWRTVTTKARINDFLPAPWRVNQSDSCWYLSNGANHYPFEDGITILSGNTVTGQGYADNHRALKKSISTYIDSFLVKLHNFEIPMPSNGDCWYCTLTDSQTGRPLGESLEGIPQSGHILSHIEESYHVPALLIRACRNYVSPLVMTYIQATLDKDGTNASQSYFDSWKSVAHRQIKSALRKYIYRAVKLAA